MSAQDEVRAASGQFYAALGRMINGDASPLDGLWSHEATASTMHPIGGRQVGWDAVQQSFAQVAALSSQGQVRLDEQLIQVVGDLAYELGVERGSMQLGGHPVTIDQRVTNIYRREAGQWKVVHHHTDQAGGMQEALKHLPGQP